MKGCQEITELIEKGNVTKLSAMDKISVRLHLAICKLCREFKKDSEIMDKAIRKALKSERKATFNEKEKDDLIVRLKDK